MTIEYKDSKRIVALSTDVVETPNVNDDLTSDKGWVSNTSDWTYNATGDYLDFATIRRSTTAQQIYIDVQDSDYLGSGNNLSDTAWTARFKFKTGTQGSSTGNILWYVSFSNNLADSGTTQQTVAMRTNVNGGGNANSLALCVSRGQFETSSSPVRENVDVLSNTNLPYSTDLYMEMTRNGDVFTLKAYTDEYVTQTGVTATATVTGISSLRYIKAFNDSEQQQSYTSTGGRLYDMKIYNGVSSLSSKPINVQDNSILIQKDTARRYWCDNPPSVTNQDIEWTNGTNVTINGNTLTATAGSWSCIARSVQTISPSRGGGTVIGKHSHNYGMFGFSKDPYWTSGNTFANGDYMIYHDEVYELGSGKSGSSFTGTDNNTVYKVTMDTNGLVKYYVDTGSGYSEVYESTVTAGANDEYYVLGVPDGSGSTVSDITITGKLPTTWTMEPTYEDDFSSDNWTDSSGSITVVNTSTGKLDWDFIKDSSNNQTAYDFTTPVNDIKWVLRFELTIDNISNTSSSSLWGQIGLFSEDETSDSGNAENGIMLNLLRTSSGTSNYKVGGLYNATNISATYTTFSRALSDETVFVELKRLGSTLVEASLFEDSTYSNLLETQQYTISSSIVDLQYIKVLNYNTGNVGGTLNGTIDNMKFYNGVGTIN